MLNGCTANCKHEISRIAITQSLLLNDTTPIVLHSSTQFQFRNNLLIALNYKRQCLKFRQPTFAYPLFPAKSEMIPAFHMIEQNSKKSWENCPYLQPHSSLYNFVSQVAFMTRPPKISIILAPGFVGACLKRIFFKSLSKPHKITKQSPFRHKATKLTTFT